MAEGSKPLQGALRWQLGDLTVTVLNDGYLQGSIDLVTGISKAEAGSLQAAGFRAEAPRITLNAFLITGPGRKPVLIDTGFGAFGGDTLGRVPGALALTGVKPEEIETVLLTHLHPDHAGGLLAGGEAAYPNAEIVLHADEAAHWLGEDVLSRAPDEAKPYFEIAAKATAPYVGRTRMISGGEEVVPGVTAVHLPGHTPGHTGFRIASGDKVLMMWTDVVHLPAIQFKQPEAGVSFDVDGDQARATRKRILDEVAGSRSFIGGSHLEFPALGYVVRESAGYSFVPELWVAAQ